MFNLRQMIRKSLGRIYRKAIGQLYPSPKMIFAVQQWLARNGGISTARCAKDTGLAPYMVAVALFLLRQASIWNKKRREHSGAVYFKTIFYAPLELRYIKMNLWESYPYVDKFIVVEANRTHVGEEREFIFEKYIEQIPEELRGKLLYIPVDLSSKTVNCIVSNDGVRMHKNEDEIWGAFEDHVELKDEDIVISTDADEIIFRNIYPGIFYNLKKNGALLLPLHQFFYRANYLWKELTVWAPTVAYAGYYRKIPRPHRWRYEGRRFPFMSGCHFSWQMTLDEMIHKLNTYAHKDIYGHFANREILRDAVSRKIYPFDPEEPFTIRELNPDTDRAWYPESFYVFRDDFAHLLPPAPIQ